MTVFECYLPNVALESEKVETESSENTSQESNRIVFETKQPVVSQVSICFQSTALNQRVYERLSSIAQNAISFTIGLDQKSSIVLTDSEETAEMASEAKVRSILMSSLSDDEIVRRAPIRLGIKG